MSKSSSKKIILASNSVQRKKLLQQLGLKFTVKASQVEELTKIKSNCVALVKDNALLKAQDVASRLKDGVVIGADTVVYIGNNTILGKPRNIEEARKILRILFTRPQWVYTGVVVIDVKAKKTIIDYEKTKVYMLPLDKNEIAAYHRKVNPFDKAGGFDIEGFGSTFIHRIEGCYTNVIGLPMAKLATMLKKVGVSIL
ncbi:MAG: septum formation protein Maf [Candidatus Omnitrophica bacterium]|nr:septum formation protein Maf [Candidatus Omnitrophota bacterium]MCB9747556.1 septum formation protein Maf [Candidatus Omnitrophota bacterium]